PPPASAQAWMALAIASVDAPLPAGRAPKSVMMKSRSGNCGGRMRERISGTRSHPPAPDPTEVRAWLVHPASQPAGTSRPPTPAALDLRKRLLSMVSVDERDAHGRGKSGAEIVEMRPPVFNRIELTGWRPSGADVVGECLTGCCVE